jgi:hypothetical protein
MFPGFILPLHFLVPLFWLFLSPQYLIKSWIKLYQSYFLSH